MVCGRAEAADVTVHMERDNLGIVRCWAVNHGPYNVCAVLDVYPWSTPTGHLIHRPIAHNIAGNSKRPFHFAPIGQRPPLKCTLISAKYGQPYAPCNP
jgi:hypothetical protein